MLREGNATKSEEIKMARKEINKMRKTLAGQTALAGQMAVCPLDESDESIPVLNIPLRRDIRI